MVEELLQWINILPAGLAYVALGIILLAVAGIVKDFMTPYNVGEQMNNQDNPALGLSITGYYIGVIIVFIGALYDPKENLGMAELATAKFGLQVAECLGYSIGGILLLNLARLIVDKLVLSGFSTHKEIIEDRNSGTGAVEFGSYVASALVIAGSISGTTKGPWWQGIVTGLCFFILGQVVFVIYSKFYQLITSHDVHAEIEKDNVAAGVAFGGNIVAIGVILFKSVAGNFEGWEASLTKFILMSVLGFVVLFLVRILVDAFLLPKSTISQEIVEDRNINAAYVEGAVLIGVAAIITFAI